MAEVGDGLGTAVPVPPVPPVVGVGDPPGAPSPEGICPQPAVMITRTASTPMVGPRMHRPYVAESMVNVC